MNSAGEPLSASDVENYLRVLRAAIVGQEPTEPNISSAAEKYLAFLAANARQQVIRRWLADRVVLEPPAVLSRGGPRPWFEDYDPSTGYHWRRLRDFLITARNRSESALDSLDQSTNRILGMLEDPRPGGPPNFRVQGLVVGYIQAGKTANFTALIAKSVDAGYRIVIVLSGLHNSLRRQTQLRLEDELGLVQPIAARPGVGLADDDHQISRMTLPEVWGDFNPGTADPSLLYSGGRIIMVVKKNASVLRRLVTWLEARQPIIPPVLVIDDEADQASINTGGNRQPLDELTDLSPADVDAAAGPDGLAGLSPSTAADETNPSVINRLIRRLLTQMRRVSYVGYTATPFANVLIGHEDFDREVYEDLYPADFIISLPQPAGYVGPERLFGRSALPGESGEDVHGIDVLRQVPDWEAAALLDSRVSSSAGQLPPTLQLALTDFVLALAARDTRTGAQPTASMLIHASSRVAQQDTLVELVRNSLAELRQRWRYQNDAARAEFQQRWEREFIPVTAAMDLKRVLRFEQIEEALNKVFRDELPVLILHNRSTDELDYERNPNLRAVIVGGNKLSRGLTLEGLLTSYYVRPANFYDTLLQMGRWFGFREEYADLTRLWTTAQLADRFRDLAAFEEELRREIKLYESLHKTPRDFGPRIRTHPAMQITARNRMGSAREISYNYAATLQQTIAFHLTNRQWLQHNLDATRRFLPRLGPPNATDKGDGLPTWRNVDWRQIERFLGDGEYQTYEEATRFMGARVREYIATQATKHGELIRWWVHVRGLQKAGSLGEEDLHIQGWTTVACIARNREAASETSIGSLINPVSLGGRGDEDIGLSEDDRQWARRWSKETGVSYAVSLRRRRSREEGLLVIYPISPLSEPKNGNPEDSGKQRLFDDPDRDGVTVIGVAVSFPHSDTAATVSYVVGSAGEPSA